MQHLNRIFSIKNLGDLGYFLVVEVIRKYDTKIILCQGKYITEILDRGGMKQVKAMSAPKINNLRLSKYIDESIENEQKYRSIVMPYNMLPLLDQT